jgi:hypothetical protein
MCDLNYHSNVEALGVYFIDWHTVPIDKINIAEDMNL